MADARLRVILEAQTQSLKAGMASVKQELAGVREEVRATNAASSLMSGSFGKIGALAGGLGTALKVVGAGMGGIAGVAAAVASGVTNAAAAFQNLINSIKSNPFVETASQFQTYEAQFKAFLGTTQRARGEMQKLVAEAQALPFELPGLVEADIQLRSYQQSVERFLPVAETLAAVAGRDLPEAASALGQALSGIPEGVTRLQESFRLTRRDLIAAGAEVDRAGTIMSKTANQAEKLARAIETVSKEKFGGAIAERAKTLGTIISNLEDAFTKLKNAIGQQMAPGVARLAELLSLATDKMTGFFEQGGLVTQILEKLAPLFNLTAEGVEKLLNALPGSDVSDFGSKARKAVDETTESLREMGQESTAQVLEFQGLRESIEKLQETATKFKPGAPIRLRLEDKIAGLKEQLAARQKQKAAAAEVEAQERQTADTQIQAAKDAETAIDKFYKARQNHIFATKKQELDAADAALDAANQSVAAVEQIINTSKDPERVKEAEKALAGLKQQREKLEIDRVDLARDTLEKLIEMDRAHLEQRLALGQIGKAEEGKALDELADKAERLLKADIDRREVRGELTKAEADSLRDQVKTSELVVNLRREATRTALEGSRAEREAAIAVAEAQAQAAENKAEAAREDLARGGDIVRNEQILIQAVKDRTQAEINALKAKAALEKEQNPEQKAEIEQRTQAEIKRLRGEEIVQLREVAETTKQARAIQIEANNQVIASEQQLANARLAAAQKKFDQTGKGGADILKELELIQRLEEERIRGEERAALATEKNAFRRVAIQKKADDDIAASRINSTLQTEEQLKAIAIRRAESRVKDAEAAQRELQNKKAIYEEEVRLGTAVGQRRQREIELALEAYRLQVQMLQAKRDEAVAQANVSDKQKVGRDYDLQILQAKRDIKGVLQQINQEYGKGNTELDKQLRKLQRIRGRQDDRRQRREEAEDKQERGEALTPEEEAQLKKDQEDERRDKIAERKAEERRKAEARKDEFKRQAEAEAALERARRDELRKQGKTPAEINAQIAEERRAARAAGTTPFQTPAASEEKGPEKAPSAAEETSLGKDKGKPKPPGPTPPAASGGSIEGLLASIDGKLTLTNTELARQTALYSSYTGGNDTERPHRTKGVS